MRILSRYSMPAEAHIVLARLNSAGIKAVIRDEHTIQFDWLLSNAIGGVKLEVADEDYEDALVLINEVPPENGLIKCPSCGSTEYVVRPLGVLAAICMAIKIPVPSTMATVDCKRCKHIFMVPMVPSE